MSLVKNVELAQQLIRKIESFALQKGFELERGKNEDTSTKIVVTLSIKDIKVGRITFPELYWDSNSKPIVGDETLYIEKLNNKFSALDLVRNYISEVYKGSYIFASHLIISRFSTEEY